MQCDNKLTLPKGTVKCLLCNASISVRSGTLEKFKSHLDNDHDAFFGQDVLIATNFLEAHEKEAIIEKVLPRINYMFDKVGNDKGDNLFTSKKKKLLVMNCIVLQLQYPRNLGWWIITRLTPQ